jgi:nicotinate-nucleotide adenylyltransferase
VLKIGFLGGAFDPIHFGHLLIAQDAVEQLGLDRVDFVPTAISPLKGRALVASPADRLAMVERAIADDPRFGVLDDELRRGGVSYTVDTARALVKRFPGDRLFWLIGADQVQQLGDWREISELVRLVEFGQFARPGCAVVAPPEVPGLRLHAVRSHRVEVSSTELRERVRLGRPLRYFVPLKVNHYIESKSLYRDPA